MGSAVDAAAKPRRKLRGLHDRRVRVSRAGLYDRAVNRLRTLIVRGALAPGEPLNEAELCEALGISRTPLREALKLLAAEGLVQLRPNRSGIVAPLLREQLDDLFEAVSIIERAAAELAAVRMTERDIEKLAALQDRLERYHGGGKLREYFELNQQIHALIVALSGNETLKATHQWLFARVERARFIALSRRGRWDQSVDEHRKILGHLKRRESEKAGKLLARHVQRTGRAVADLVEEAAGKQRHRRPGRRALNRN